MGSGALPSAERACAGNADLGRVFDLLARGEITAQVAAVYPLREAAAALRRAEEGGLTGKIVLVR